MLREFNKLLTQTEFDYMRLDALATTSNEMIGNSYRDAVKWLVENENITIESIINFEEEFAFTQLVRYEILLEENGVYRWCWEEVENG